MNNIIKRGVRVGAMLLVWMAMVVSAQGASFDCAKAGTKVEQAICDNPEISKLDEELAASYKAALKDHTQANTIKQAQRQWLKERNRCEDVVCVKQIFEVRLSELKKLLAAMSKPNTKYVMISGKGQAICEQVFKQMNEGPELCALDLLATIPGVELPKWKKLDWQENKLLYERFLVAQMVKEEYYPQMFGGAGNRDIEIPLPTKEQMGKGGKFVMWDSSDAPITRERLEKEWEGAVEYGNVFYRWDGAVPAPDETDVILVETRIHRFQGGCPNVRMMRFSDDLRTPKPWSPRNSAWFMDSGKFPFKFDAHFYMLYEASGLSRDAESGMLAIPFRVLTVDIRGGNYCHISTNYSYQPQ